MARHKRAMLPDRRRLPWLGWTACALIGLACNLPIGRPTATPAPVPSTTPTVEILPSLALTPSPTMPFPDAGSVLAGVCFSFLQALNGRTVVLDSPRDLAAFYNQVDASNQCRDSATRQSFDFSNQQIVGTVVTGEGCTVDLAYDSAELDDKTRQRTLVFRAVVRGDCPYDLVRPVWLAVDRPPPGYTTQIRISGSP